MHISVAHHLFTDTRFKRGVDYVNWGLVMNIPNQHPHVFDLLVVGTKDYHTTITVDDVGHVLSAACDCGGGRYCKHLAASFIFLSRQPKQSYQMKKQLDVDLDLEKLIYQKQSLSKAIIDVCQKALNLSKQQEQLDVLFEAYEFYSEQIAWLLDHDQAESATEVLEWMMDEFVSYWTASSNDCVEMNFFDKQTEWIKGIIQSGQVDPRRIINDVMIWLQLYVEIKDETVNDWLLALIDCIDDGDLVDDVVAVLHQAKEKIKQPSKIVEAEYFLERAKNPNAPIVIDENKTIYPKIAQVYIDELIKQGQYQQAVNYVLSQIQKKPKYEDIVWVVQWVFLMEKLDDFEGLKQALRWLFYCGQEQALEQLQSHCDRRKWHQEVDYMLLQYQQKAYSDWTYRQLLVAEKRWELLKEHVKTNPWFITQLHKHLISPYPDFVYEQLKQWIMQRHAQSDDNHALKPWIMLFTSYFGEAEGWDLLAQLR